MTNEEAVNVLKTHYHKNPRTSYGVMVKQATEMAIKVLEDRRWIPVTERLPDTIGMYLITYNKDIFGKSGVTDAQWSGLCWNKWYVKSNDVIAWMPMPKPYEEGAEE